MTGSQPIVLKTDHLLGLYALVDVAVSELVRARLAKMDVHFTADPAQASHLAKPGKSVLVFGRQHPLGVRDSIASRDIPVEVDPSVVLAETTYGPPLAQLLSLGEPGKDDKDVKYRKRGLGPEHVPELIRMATDEELHTGPADSDIYWAPVHAWWALGELQAEEAIVPLLSLLRRIDDDNDDWVNDDIPEVLAQIGTAALDPTTEYLSDPAHGDWARVSAAKTIALIGQNFPGWYEDCVARLSAQLEHYAVQSPMLNAFLISSLLDLDAYEAAPVMEKAFAAGRVDEDVQGDWEDTQIELGLKTDREHERKPTKLMEIGDRLRALWAERKGKSETPSASPAVKMWTPPAVVSAKIGRNEPCPCSSGRKFKKCCGR